ISIDTTGDALHKRGYREKANKAPIRETLAAGLIYLTPWKAGRVLVDPMCGSGTILIEAAMIGINMAPGLNREFISEKWRTLDKKIWWDVRKDAFNKIDNESKFKIYGYDIDEESIDIARENAEIAGVDEYIEFNVGDATQFKSEDEFGFIITNPPYGERLEDKDSVKQLYKELGYAFRKLKNWSYYLITSYEDFEYEFGQKADKKRKLYNGMLKTNFFQYPGPKPPRNNK
ncbi:class I SAM-dependent RNA methyltransferase, partial [Clostridioides difficile]